MSTTIKKGRLVYTDPNNYTGLSNGNEYGADNTTFNMEDYGISVDLKVIVPDRSDCGLVDYENNVLYNIEMNNGQIYTTFLGGSKLNGGTDEDNYLTDSYTNISYKEVGNGNNDKENLGISSIDITYDSWMYPQVVIKFTDVRGYSLMMPEEEAYYENLSSDKANTQGQSYEIDKNKACGSFFRSLFSFPCPRFLLKVKGFYGKSVTFTLAVNEFKSSFNSRTGNFDVTVSFIGYMYGFYTDIPMKYLIIAPYDQYYGEEYWAKKQFKFDTPNDNGTLIPTFVELMNKIENAGNEITQITSNSGNIKTYKKYTQQIIALNDIAAKFKTFVKGLGQNNSTINKDAVIKGDNEILVLLGNYNSSVNSRLAFYNSEDYRALNEAIANYNKNGWDTLTLPNTKTDTNDFIMYQMFNTIQSENSKIIEFIYLNNSEFPFPDWKKRIREDKTLNSFIGESGKYRNKYVDILKNGYGFLYKTGTFLQDIENKVSDLEAKQKSIIEVINDQINNEIYNVLGFKPTLRNIFKILYAHLDTFFNVFYHCVGNIKSKGNERTVSALNLNIADTDLSAKNNGNSFVPPFPLVTKNNGDDKVIQWLENITNYDCDEISLVNGLLNATIKSKERVDFISSNIEKQTSSSIIPTNLTDILLDVNPYSRIYDDKLDVLKYETLQSILGIRFINHIYSQNNDKDSSFLGKCEAYNYYNAFPDFNERLLDVLSNCTGDDFYNFLKGTNGATSIYNLISGKTNNSIFSNRGTYNWISLDDNITWLIPTQFKNLTDIKQTLSGLEKDSYYSDPSYCKMFLSTVSHKDKKDERIYNKNIFTIFNSREILLNKKESILNNDYSLLDDKSKIFENWKIDDMNDYYSNTLSGNLSITIKGKGKKPKIEKNSNYLFKDRTYDDVGLKIYDTNGLSFKKFFSDSNFSNDAGRNSTAILKNYGKGNVDIKNIYLPTLQFGDNGSLYGSPFFYLQNENGDDNLKMRRKALLFLHSLWNSDKKLDLQTNAEIKLLSKAQLLFLGGLLWRGEYWDNNGKDCFNFDGIGGKYVSPKDKKQLLSVKCSNNFRLNALSLATNDNDYAEIRGENIFEYRQEVRDTLISYFLDWVNDSSSRGFKYFNDYFELRKIDGSEFTYKDFTSFITLFKCFGPTNNKLYVSNNVKKYEKHIGSLKLDINQTDITLHQFLTEVLDDTAYNAYERICVNNAEDSANMSFLLSHNQDSDVVNNLTKFLIEPIPVYISKQKRDINRHESDINIEINPQLIKSNFNSFKNTLLELYNYNEQKKEKRENGNVKVQSDFSDDNKLNLYLTLKNIYDKWVCGTTVKRWNLENDDSEFSSIMYVDNFYNDIGNEFIVNCDTLNELLKLQFDKNNNFSVYQFIGEIANKNKLLFITLPIKNPFINADELTDLFTPYSYNTPQNLDSKNGITYMLMYTPPMSSVLNVASDNNNMNYRNDGFDLVDTLGNISDTAPKDIFKENTEDGKKYVIPAFGVSYGMQNQNFFKSIDVNMNNPQITEQSIGITFDLAERASGKGTNNSVRFSGQNLYNIYSNHSYTCNVSMMGCAPLLPMTYFQLNNIPMFKGAYTVIKVSHHIEAGDMATNFTGVRINKNKLPINKENVFDMMSLKDRINNTKSSFSVENTFNGNDIQNIATSSYDTSKNRRVYTKPNNAGPISCDSEYTYSNIIKLKNKKGLPLLFITDISKPDLAWDGLSCNMKKLVIDIAKTIDVNDLGYTLVISSLKRNGNDSSDHNSGFAADLHGALVNDNGVIVDKKAYSANLFDLIATTYTPYIRQLIWEDKGSDTEVWHNDRVTNCIHLSSKGYGIEENGKQQIFQAKNSNGWGSIQILNKNNFYPLSNAFLATCAKLINENKINIQNINNFNLSKLINDETKDKLLEFKV